MKTAHIVSDVGRRLEVSIREDGQGYMLLIESAHNEVGMLFRLCAVLYVNQCDIVRARISTPDANLIKDEFSIRTERALGEEQFKEMVADLEKLLFDGLSVLDYLHLKKPPGANTAGGGGTVRISAGPAPEIEITSVDKPGLMLALSQAFYLMEIDVQEATIETDAGGRVQNRFLISPADRRFTNQEFCRRLSDELQVLV